MPLSPTPVRAVEEEGGVKNYWLGKLGWGSPFSVRAFEKIPDASGMEEYGNLSLIMLGSKSNSLGPSPIQRTKGVM